MAQLSMYALPVFKLLMLSPLVIIICTAVTDKNNKSLDNSVSFLYLSQTLNKRLTLFKLTVQFLFN